MTASIDARAGSLDVVGTAGFVLPIVLRVSLVETLGGPLDPELLGSLGVEVLDHRTDTAIDAATPDVSWSVDEGVVVVAVEWSAVQTAALAGWSRWWRLAGRVADGPEVPLVAGALAVVSPRRPARRPTRDATVVAHVGPQVAAVTVTVIATDGDVLMTGGGDVLLWT